VEDAGLAGGADPAASMGKPVALLVPGSGPGGGLDDPSSSVAALVSDLTARRVWSDDKCGPLRALLMVSACTPHEGWFAWFVRCLALILWLTRGAYQALGGGMPLIVEAGAAGRSSDHVVWLGENPLARRDRPSTVRRENARPQTRCKDKA